MDMGEMGKYHMFNRPHGMIGGMMNKPPEMAQVPPHWMIYFRVPDINAAVERDQEERREDPQRTDGGARRRLGGERQDPQGAAFSLHAKKA